MRRCLSLQGLAVAFSAFHLRPPVFVDYSTHSNMWGSSLRFVCALVVVVWLIATTAAERPVFSDISDSQKYFASLHSVIQYEDQQRMQSRVLLASTDNCSDVQTAADRRIDGSCNNVAQPDLGKVGHLLNRAVANRYRFFVCLTYFSAFLTLRQ